MSPNKKLRTLILAIIALSILPLVFFFLTTSFSEPVNNLPIYGEGKKATAEDYNNCLILYPNQTIFITSGAKDTLIAKQIIPAIQKNLESVKETTFNIIVSPNTNHKMILQALDACTISDIKEYKLLEL